MSCLKASARRLSAWVWLMKSLGIGLGLVYRFEEGVNDGRRLWIGPRAHPRIVSRINREPMLHPVPSRVNLALVEVCLPAGAEEYLRTRTCEIGSRPTFVRRQNLGPRSDPPDDLSQSEWQKAGDPTQPLARGEVDYHVVDPFLLKCGTSGMRGQLLVPLGAAGNHPG